MEQLVSSAVTFRHFSLLLRACMCICVVVGVSGADICSDLLRFRDEPSFWTRFLSNATREFTLFPIRFQNHLEISLVTLSKINIWHQRQTGIFRSLEREAIGLLYSVNVYWLHYYCHSLLFTFILLPFTVYFYTITVYFYTVTVYC